MKEAYEKDQGRLFTSACSDRKSDNSFKVKEGRFKSDIRKNFFFLG